VVTSLAPSIFVGGALLALSGCMVVPRTTATYEPECQVVTKHIELEIAQVGYFAGCRNNAECSAILATAGFVAVASAVVSGSYAVVGNVVYWLERQGRCLVPD
jgi:hypothetical protein